MDVRVETIAPVRVAYVRAVGPYHLSLPPAWKRMNAYAARRGLAGPAAWFLTIAHNNPRTTPPDQLRADACISVGVDFVADDDVRVQTIPGGLHAVATYVGPYAGLPAAWGSFAGQWSAAHGYHGRPGPCFDRYVNDPATTPADQLVTELYEPIEA